MSEGEIAKILNLITLQHEQVVRKHCVSFAEIGVAIIEQAEDTIWINNGCTALDLIFQELGLEYEHDPKETLKEFINDGPKTEIEIKDQTRTKTRQVGGAATERPRNQGDAFNPNPSL